MREKNFILLFLKNFFYIYLLFEFADPDVSKYKSAWNHIIFLLVFRNTDKCNKNCIINTTDIFSPKQRCWSWQFGCDNGCIPREKKCNGVQDCNDKSDEKNCVKKKIDDYDDYYIHEYNDDNEVSVISINNVSKVLFILSPRRKFFK